MALIPALLAGGDQTVNLTMHVRRRVEVLESVSRVATNVIGQQGLRNARDQQLDHVIPPAVS